MIATEVVDLEKFQRLSPHTQHILFHLCAAYTEQTDKSFTSKEWNDYVAGKAAVPSTTVKNAYYRHVRKWSDVEKQAYLTWYKEQAAATHIVEKDFVPQADTEADKPLSEAEPLLQEEQAQPELLPVDDLELVPVQGQSAATSVQPSENSMTFHCNGKQLLVFQQGGWYCRESQLLSFLHLSSKNTTFRSILLPHVKSMRFINFGKSRAYRLEQVASFTARFLQITTNETQRAASSYLLKQYEDMAAQGLVPPVGTSEDEPVLAAPAEEKPVIQAAPVPPAPINPDQKELDRLIRLLNETVGFLSAPAKEELLRLIAEQGYVATTLGIMKAWEDVQQDLSLHFLRLAEERIRGRL